MAYRKYKKNYYKRKYNKYKFTKYNTYKNRSSKAQANQIFTLNKKIKNLETKTKPEMKEYTPNDYLLSPADKQTTINVWNTIQTYNATADLSEKIDASTCRFSKIIFNGVLERVNNTKLEGNSLGTQQFDTFKYSCYVRLAVLYLPTEKAYTPAADEFFEQMQPMTSVTETYGPSGFKAPLKKGCGSICKILKVKRYKITQTNINAIPVKFSVNLWKYNKFKPAFVKKTNNGVNERGSIFVVGDILIQPNSRHDITHPFDESKDLAEQFEFKLFSKLLYYDA